MARRGLTGIRFDPSVQFRQVGLALDSASARLDPILERTPVLRVFHRIGVARLFRDGALAFWLLAMLVQPLLFWRPDLLHPTTIGTDASNYAATTQRMAARHPLYALSPGDRPVPQDNPPEWTVPILSPPATATVNLWQTVLPESLGMYVIWAAGLAAMTLAGQLIVLRGKTIFVALLIYLTAGLAITAWSGNVNALIAPAAMLVWWASRQSQRGWLVLAGVIVAVAACVKIGPLFLGIWLIAQRRWLAVGASVVAALVLTAVTALVAGVDVFFDYLAIARSTSASATPLSIPGILAQLGAPPELQQIALPAAMLLAAVLIVVLRRSPLSFGIAILAMIFSTPVVRHETIAPAIVAAVAWFAAAPRNNLERPNTRARTVAIPAMGAVLIASVVTAASLLTGGGDRSTFAAANRTSGPVMVRFSLHIQEASFGFLVPPGETTYGWLERWGASPPLATVWSAECELLGEVRMPRTGASLEVRADGVREVAQLSNAQTFAAYSPDCFEELKRYLEKRP